ncbi:copper ion binding protein [Bacillus subtilis]|uniref:copper ion binding protein n=1 Tax=Bacillus subtilis TaxID=1423 RepID=UPI003AF147A6
MNKEIKETNFQITGMTCAACATRIEKGIKKINGVKEANVNLALEKSSIKYDPEVVTEQEFQKKIQDLGYDVVKEKVEFDITGMTCAACASKIEKNLNKLDGVDKATVNFALETVLVEYNPEQASVPEIKEAIKKLGYTLEQKKENTEQQIDHRQKEIEKQQGKFIFSLGV